MKNKTDKTRMAKVTRKRKKEEFIVEKKMEIVRIIGEKQEEEEEYLIEIRIVEEMVPRWFHNYLKVFEKKESEKMLTRKT